MKPFSSFLGNSAYGPWPLFVKRLCDGNEAAFFQAGQVRAQVAFCGACMIFEVSEISLFHCHQKREDGKPHRSMDQGIQLDRIFTHPFFPYVLC